MKELAILMLNLFIHLGLIIAPSYFVFYFFHKKSFLKDKGFLMVFLFVILIFLFFYIEKLFLTYFNIYPVIIYF
ncbi:hypothetical protein A4G16_05965 [Mannheimia granulomatis]|uniref:Uncharacterized protein n=1 Tax=Mannheimia granulomatis TaxID=85402 RepID=A0A6G8JIG6_9PAST|nr:hypothetical protein A4G16_05965 [Mannheimia granulomatis]